MSEVVSLAGVNAGALIRRAYVYTLVTGGANSQNQYCRHPV